MEERIFKWCKNNLVEGTSEKGKHNTILKKVKRT